MSFFWKKKMKNLGLNWWNVTWISKDQTEKTTYSPTTHYFFASAWKWLMAFFSACIVNRDYLCASRSQAHTHMFKFHLINNYINDFSSLHSTTLVRWNVICKSDIFLYDFDTIIKSIAISLYVLYYVLRNFSCFCWFDYDERIKNIPEENSRNWTTSTWSELQRL